MNSERQVQILDEGVYISFHNNTVVGGLKPSLLPQARDKLCK